MDHHVLRLDEVPVLLLRQALAALEVPLLVEVDPARRKLEGV
jgi:hypothetical protein